MGYNKEFDFADFLYNKMNEFNSSKFRKYTIRVNGVLYECNESEKVKIDILFHQFSEKRIKAKEFHEKFKLLNLKLIS